jgi:hypothetical protein
MFDQYGKKINVESAFAASPEMLKRWADRLKKELGREPFYKKFLCPVLVDRFGNRLAESNASAVELKGRKGAK